jgi:hypothetical protein
MSEWLIPLFPANGVAVTMTTTVWIGALIVIFFNLRFGWTLSGLVIPGYLVPLIITKPTAATVIVVEAILTYWIVHVLSEWPHYLKGWSSFFGRDRFLALIVVSVVVRCILDGWLLPWAGQQLSEQFDITIDYRHDLHSYGLIIVSLIANYFWKPGLLRGIGPLSVSIGLCYVIIQYGLTRFTNFNLGSLQYLYDDIASSLLASPKAYIVLLTTAFVASWLNLRYSWEFSGILIPALLGLLWHDPFKIVVSLAEAAAIFTFASLLLKLPLWSKTTMEGGRKIAFFFTVCFVYRIVLAHVLPLTLVGFRTTDAFGFGYLLTTMLAMKAYDKKVCIRVVKATLSTSMLGAVVGSIFGFALTWVDTGLRAAPDSDAANPRIARATGSLVELVRSDKIRIYETRQPESYQVPLRDEMKSFEAGLSWLKQFVSDGDSSSLRSAQQWLAIANYEVLRVEDRYVYLREFSPRRNWGMYVIDTQTESELLIQVPAPINEWGTLESGLTLFRHLEARVLAIWGADRFSNRDGASDELVARNTTMRICQKVFDNQSTLQVRGHSEASVRAITRSAGTVAAHSVHAMQSSLWVCRSLPSGFRMNEVAELIGEFDVQWSSVSERNVLRDDATRGFASIFLSNVARQKLVNRLEQIDQADEADAFRILDGSLSQWLLESKSLIARRGTNAYIGSSLDELLFVDEEVLTPVVHVLGNVKSLAECSEEQIRLLNAAAAAARVIDYELVVVRDDFRGQHYAVLSEPAPRQRNWGTYVFRFGLTEPRVVQVPRPLLERSSFDFGVSLFERPAASALMVAGANPRANMDGSSDVTRLANKVNLYNLVQQVFLREMQSRSMLIVQARAIQSPVDADVVVAVHDGTTLYQNLTPLVTELVSQLRRDGLSTRFVDGGDDVAGYEIGLMMQSSTLNQTQNKQLASLWLSPTLRSRFRHQESNSLQHAEFEAVGVPSLNTSLFKYLLQGEEKQICDEIPDDLFDAISEYVANGDVIQLRRIVVNWPKWRITRLLDDLTGQSVMLVSRDNCCPHVINLSADSYLDRDEKTITEKTETAIRKFIDSRQGWTQIVPNGGDLP